MENCIQISKLNDFIFCPLSIFFHGIYEDFDEQNYHTSSQVIGKINHLNIDNSTYSTSSRFITGIDVYSEKYGLCGKIDIYDKSKEILIERKYKIKKIYLGYLYQLWAQYFCMIEMGFCIKNLFLHSLSDNKRYKINIPNKDDILEFEKFLVEFKNFDIYNNDLNQNINKCKKCIYRNLCKSI